MAVGLSFKVSSEPTESACCFVELYMAGPNETYEIELKPDQMAFVQSAREKYDIADDSKVLRIVLDYLLNSPEVHDAVFTETRCLRCD